MKNSTPPYSMLDEVLPTAPLVIESLSQLLQFSMGLAAWKDSGDSSWAVRCNASSGNLHPTETYLIMPTQFLDNSETTVYHYSPKNHELETLASFQTDYFQTLETGSFLVAFSSIVWREVWKYGERAFRYSQLDVGHAIQALNVSAKLLGWNLSVCESISETELSSLLGLNQSDRFFETESPDILIMITPNKHSKKDHLNNLLQHVPLKFDGIANKLSTQMHTWDIIPQIEDATQQVRSDKHFKPYNDFTSIKRVGTKESKDVILNRRSIHVMDTKESFIPREQFYTILNSISNNNRPQNNLAHLVIFVHRVKELESGLYLLLRNENDKESLKTETKSTFLWSETSFKNLYLLEKNDYKISSKALSCTQDIASDGAFSLGMLCNFSKTLHDDGTHKYKEIYWECGAIGQQLYLEATSLGLSGTGIGCFLDDTVHDILGLKNNLFQSMYHFTLGKGYVDSRIQTRPAYTRA
jgi:SagB-type dehydrogenase family enzyme